MYLADGSIGRGNYYDQVFEASGEITIISGAHGSPNGRIDLDDQFVELDQNLFPGANVLDIGDFRTDAGRAELASILQESEGTIIVAICNSQVCLPDIAGVGGIAGLGLTN